MKRTPLIALLLSLALAGAACASRSNDGGAGASGSTGVTGIVLLGPQCPVERADSPCPDLPIVADVVATKPDGNIVVTVRSSSDGRFTMSLPAGEYILKAVNLEGIQSAKPVYVTVPATGFADVTIPVDTGIR